MVTTVDEYILQFPPEVQSRLRHMRALIKEAAPMADEKISWAMPTFAYHGNVVHMAAHKRHIGFYPGASGVASFADKLKAYQTSKGAVQFPYDQPLPDDLIREIVAFRVKENEDDAEAKAASKKKA